MSTPSFSILDDALHYFYKYLAFDTMSDPDSEVCPSNPNIRNLALQIQQDLQDLGIEARVDDHAYLFASVPGNHPASHTLGLIAHMDTSPDMTGANVNARRVTYTGQPIILNEEDPAYQAGLIPPLLLSADYFPQLSADLGKDLIVTDGTSLLGADDKAGLAEIMALAKYLTDHPEYPHGTIKIAFTPDEEIGRGADLFDVKALGADVAYTMDGSGLGEIEWENFNAASARITVQGLNVHPGSAKDKMINSQLWATRFIQALPQDQTPASTEGYEGFYHLTDLHGDVELTELNYIIRDFDADSFAQRKSFLYDLVDRFNTEAGKEIFRITVKDSYFNMKEKIRPVYFLVEYAKAAMTEVGVKPKELPIRGGTDGARLSYMGLPCPNLFTGGQNFHGRYEYLSVDTMDKALQTLLALLPKFLV